MSYAVITAALRYSLRGPENVGHWFERCRLSKGLPTEKIGSLLTVSYWTRNLARNDPRLYQGRVYGLLTIWYLGPALEWFRNHHHYN